MTRYADPDAGRISRAAVTVFTVGDYAPFIIGGGLVSFGSTITALVVMIDNSQPLGALFLIPLALMILISAVAVRKSYNNSESSRGDSTLNQAYPLFNQIRGEDTEVLALPIMRKIYAHAKEGGHTYSGACNSGSCGERISVLSKLVPADRRVGNKSDIDAAKQYIKMIEDAEKSHRQMLKELGEG